jgi:hypothetical protein
LGVCTSVHSPSCLHGSRGSTNCSSTAGLHASTLPFPSSTLGCNPWYGIQVQLRRGKGGRMTLTPSIPCEPFLCLKMHLGLGYSLHQVQVSWWCNQSIDSLTLGSLVTDQGLGRRVPFLDHSPSTSLSIEGRWEWSRSRSALQSCPQTVVEGSGMGVCRQAPSGTSINVKSSWRG